MARVGREITGAPPIAKAGIQLAPATSKAPTEYIGCCSRRDVAIVSLAIPQKELTMLVWRFPGRKNLFEIDCGERLVRLLPGGVPDS